MKAISGLVNNYTQYRSASAVYPVCFPVKTFGLTSGWFLPRTISSGPQVFVLEIDSAVICQIKGEGYAVVIAIAIAPAIISCGYLRRTSPPFSRLLRVNGPRRDEMSRSLVLARRLTTAMYTYGTMDDVAPKQAVYF